MCVFNVFSCVLVCYVIVVFKLCSKSFKAVLRFVLCEFTVLFIVFEGTKQEHHTNNPRTVPPPRK